MGTRKSLSGYTIYFERRAEGAPRLGILVTRRHAASAVERNRLKRCIREAFRLEQAGLGAIDLLVRPPFGMRYSASKLRQLRVLLAGLGR